MRNIKLSDDEVRGRTQTTLKLANVTGQSTTEIAEQLTAIWNNFYDGSKSLEYYADVLTALGAATASSSDEISEGLQKFASVGETVGLSYEYAAAALATVTATTRQSADVVGTSFKTLFSRLQDLELGDTLDDGTTLGTYSQALNTVGVNIKTTSGELKDMDTILDELGEKWETLSSAQQVALAETVGGTRQYTQLIALMDNWDFFKENVGIATDSEGALQEQSDTYAQRWEAAKDRITASLEEIYQTLINEDFFIQLADFGSGLLGVLNDLIKGMGGFKGILSGVLLVATKIKETDLQNTLFSWSKGFKESAAAAQNNNRKLQDQMLTAAQTAVDNGQISKTQAAELTDTIEIAKLRQQMLDPDAKLTEGARAQLSARIDEYEMLKKLKRELEEILQTQSKSAVRGQEGAVANQQVSAGFKNVDTTMQFTKTSHKEIQAYWNTFNKGALTGRKSMNEVKSMMIDAKGVASHLSKAVAEGGDSFQAITNECKLTQEQADYLNTKLQETGYTGELLKANDPFGLYQEKIDLANQAVDGLKQKLMSVAEKSDVFKEMGISADQFEKILDKILESVGLITTDSEEMGKAIETSFKGIEKGFQSGKEASAMAARFTALSQVAMSFSMTLSQISSITSTLLDDSTSGWDKVISLMSTLVFMTMSQVSAYRTLKNAAKQAGEAGQKAWADILGPLYGVLLAIEIAIAAITLIIKLAEKHAEEAQEEAKAAAELTKATKEQTEANQELASSYEELFEEYKELHDAMEDTSSVEEQMRDKIKELREQYDLTTASIALLTGTYEDYEKVLAEVQERRQEELEASRDEAEAQTKTIENGAYYASKQSGQSRSTASGQLLLRLDGAGFSGTSTAQEKKAAELYKEALTSAGATFEGKAIGELVTGQWYGGRYTFDKSNIVDIYDSVVATSEKLEKIYGDEVTKIGQYVDAQEWIADVKEAVELLRENEELIGTYDLASKFGKVENYSDFVKVLDEWKANLEEQGATEEQIEKLINSAVKVYGSDEMEKYWTTEQSVKDITETSDYWGAHEDVLRKIWNTLDQSTLALINWGTVNKETFAEAYGNADKYRRAVESVENALTNLQAFSKYSDWDGLLTLDNYSEILNAFAWGTNGLPTQAEFLAMTPNERKKWTSIGSYSQTAALIQGSKEKRASLATDKESLQAVYGELLSDDKIQNYEKAVELVKGSAIVGSQAWDEWRDLETGEVVSTSYDPNYSTAINEVMIGKAQPDADTVHAYSVGEKNFVEDSEGYTHQAQQYTMSALNRNLGVLFDTNEKKLTAAGEAYIAYATNAEDVSSLSAEASEYYSLLSQKNVEIDDELVENLQNAEKLGADLNSASDVLDQINAKEEQINKNDIEYMIYLQLNVSQVYEDLDELRENIKDTISSISKGISFENGDYFFDTEATEKLLDNEKLRQYLEWDEENSYWKVQEGQFENFKNAVIDGYGDISKAELEELRKTAQEKADAYYDAYNKGIETTQDEFEKGLVAVSNAYQEVADIDSDTIDIDIAANTDGATDVQTALNDTQNAADELHKSYLDYYVYKYQEMYTLAQGIAEANAGRLTADKKAQFEEDYQTYQEQIDEIDSDLLNLKDDYSTTTKSTTSDGLAMTKALAEYWQAVADKCSLGLSELREQSEEFLQAIADLNGLSVEELQHLIDAYHELKRELEALETTYERVSKKRETLFGTGHLDALKDELSLLESEASKLDDLTSAAKASVDTWSTELNSLAAEGGLEVGEHFYYDENGVIQNYDELLKLYDRWNSGSDSDKEKATRLKTLIENQEQAVDDFWDYYNKKAEKEIEIQEKKIEAATYELDVYVEIKNMNDAAVNFSKKIAQSIGDELTYGDEVFGYDVDNAQRQLELANQQVATYENLMALYRSGGITGGQLQKELSELQNNMIKNGEDLLSMAETLENRLPNAIKAASTRFAEFTKQLSNNISVLEAIKKLYDLQNITYKTTEGFESLQTLYSEKMRASVQDAKNQRQWMQKAEAQLQEAEAALAAASETDTNYDMLKSARDALLEEYQSAQSAMLESAEKALTAAQEMFTNAIEKAGYDFEQAMTNGLGFDYLQDQYEKFTTSSERYLDSVNSVYEISKLNRELQTSIDKANSTYAANQLKALEAEIAARQEDGKLSEYEVKILQAKYDMTLKQISLEEAQNAKTQMRLQRNSSGNWSYVYTTDAEAISNAQQELEDAQNEYYNLAKDRVNDITKEMIEMWSDYKDEVDDILEDSSLSTEEKQARLLETTEYYSNLMTELEADKQQAIADMTEAGGLVIDDFENTYAAALDDMTKDGANFEAALEDYMAAAEDAMNEYDDTIDEVTKDCGISFEELKEQIDKVSDSNTKLANTATSAIDEIWSKIPSIQDVATEFSNLAEKIREAILELQEYVQEAAKANFNDTYTGNGADGINLGDNNTIVPTDTGNGNGGDKTTGNEDTSEQLSKVGQNAYNEGYQAGYSDGYNGKITNPPPNRYTDTTLQSIFYKSYQNGYNKGYEAGEAARRPSSGGLNSLPLYTYNGAGMLGFDTGGYTGSFSGPALALLHQKELVLNEEDTSNILNAVNLTRSIGTDVLAAISSVLDANAASVGSVMATRLGVAVPSSTGAADLNQQVSISATFPGVQSASEIEQALNNLINDAAQYASIKRD